MPDKLAEIRESLRQKLESQDINVKPQDRIADTKKLQDGYAWLWANYDKCTEEAKVAALERFAELVANYEETYKVSPQTFLDEPAPMTNPKAREDMRSVFGGNPRIISETKKGSIPIDEAMAEFGITT